MSQELEHLAATCLFPGFPGHVPPDWVRRWLDRGLGGVVLYARNIDDRVQLGRLTDSLRSERGDLLVAIDEEGGDVTRLEAADGSSYPGNAALGVVDDVELTEQVAAAIGADLASVGVDLDFAPVADVNTNPLNPIIGIRSFGAEPELAARHVAAFVRGLQGQGVAACPKHFPGHGDTEADSHLELPVVHDDLDAFVGKALPPFRAAIEAGAASIMTAHILVPALDDRPATTSRIILGDLLRCELGFDRMVMTDALEMRAISAVMGVEEGAVRALQAGADALCLGHDLGEEALVGIQDAIVAAVRARRLSEARLVEAASRVRGTSTWVAAQQKGGAVSTDIGLVAARSALKVEGEPALERTPLVVDLEPRPSIAAGASAGPGEWLRRALPDAEVVRLTEGDGAAIPALEGRQLVVVVRDAHRHAWQQQVLAELLAAEDDAIVLEVGLPHWRPTGARAYLATYGGARVNLEAAAERMAEAPVAGLYSGSRRGVEQSGSSPGS
jgi:beta-N-acetylhexosaminidase